MKGNPKQFFVLHLGSDPQGEAWLQLRDHKLDLLGQVEAGNTKDLSKKLAAKKLPAAQLQEIENLVQGQLLMIRL